MYFTLTTRIHGDRTAFGYSHSGVHDGTGRCTVKEAVDLLNENLSEFEWAHSKWSGDVLTVEFERQEGNDQFINLVELQSEAYAEFLVLKKWEKDNGFI